MQLSMMEQIHCWNRLTHVGVKAWTLNTHNPTHTETYRRLVAGTTINGTTLLSTDYLNHFNEFVMMLELTADMPDMAADIADWQPKSYAQHFADSGFSHADLAIAAYDHAPREFRVPLAGWHSSQRPKRAASISLRWMRASGRSIRPPVSSIRLSRMDSGPLDR